MTSRQRLQLVLRGERPDRPPASFWRHHPRHEITADGLVQATLDFQRRFGWDLVKINPRAEYHSEAWGNRYAFYLDDHRRPTLIAPRVRQPDDWRRLAVLDPTDGVLGEHLAAVRRIRHQLDADVPIVMTVFTPLSIAAELAGVRETRPADVFQHPEELAVGLRTITATFAAFVRELMAAGCDGIFLATTRLGTRRNLTNEQFRQFSRPDDLEILAVAQRAWLNVLHVCGTECMLDVVADYPVALWSWDMADAANPRPGSFVRPGRAAIGGVAQDLTAEPARLPEVLQQVRGVWAESGGRHIVVGAGCVVPTNVNMATLDAIREAVECGLE